MRLRRCTRETDNTSKVTTPTPTATSTAQAEPAFVMRLRRASGTDVSASAMTTIRAGRSAATVRPINGIAMIAPTTIAAFRTPTPSAPMPSRSRATSTSSTSSKPRATLNTKTNHIMTARPVCFMTASTPSCRSRRHDMLLPRRWCAARDVSRKRGTAARSIAERANVAALTPKAHCAANSHTIAEPSSGPTNVAICRTERTSAFAAAASRSPTTNAIPAVNAGRYGVART